MQTAREACLPTEYRITRQERVRYGAVAAVCAAVSSGAGYALAHGSAHSHFNAVDWLGIGACSGLLLVATLARAFGPTTYLHLHATGFTYHGLFRTRIVAWRDVESARFMRRGGKELPVYMVRHWRRPAQWPVTLRIALSGGWPLARQLEAAFTHYRQAAAQARPSAPQ